MKYLRRINESAEEDFNQDVRDILLEIEDFGYTATVLTSTYPKNGPYYVVWIEIVNRPLDGNYNTPIDFNDVKDCLLILKDYLGDKYIECKTHVNDHTMEGNWLNIELDEDTTIDYEFRCIEISYNPYKGSRCGEYDHYKSEV